MRPSIRVMKSPYLVNPMHPPSHPTHLVARTGRMANALVALGVDGIITNRPALIHQTLSK